MTPPPHRHHRHRDPQTNPRSRAADPADDTVSVARTDIDTGTAGEQAVDLGPVVDTTTHRRGADSDVGEVLRLGELSNLPASVSLLDAARALGIGRTSAYQLARRGQFPCPLIKVGALYRVPTAGLLRLLALTPPTLSSQAESTG